MKNLNLTRASKLNPFTLAIIVKFAFMIYKRFIDATRFVSMMAKFKMHVEPHR